MAQQIRIAIDIEQKAEQNIPITFFLNREEYDWQTETDVVRPVDIFENLEDTEPAQQPIVLENGSGRVFVDDGGKFLGRFLWTAADQKERDFEETFEVPVPPLCPRCENRVPELVDYLCDSCRFGN